MFLNLCVKSLVTVAPAAPIRLLSTLRLMASVKPESVSTNIIWVGPGGIPMKSETKPNAGTVAKVPQIQKNDSGAYVCMVRPWSTGRNVLFPFNVEVTVDGEQCQKVSLNLPALIVGSGICFRNSSSGIIYSSIL